MRTNLYLKTQAQLRTECATRLTDSRYELGTPEQYLAAINEAILMWHGRVTLPKLYALGDGFTSGVYEYALPAYVNPPFDLQVRSHSYMTTVAGVVSVDDNDTNATWHSLAGYAVEPTALGGWLLRLPSAPAADAARIVFWGQNGPMPTVSAILYDFVDEAATTLRVRCEQDVDIAPNGWLRIDSEVLSYGDIVRVDTEESGAPGVYDLTNCVRGLYGTRPNVHAMGILVLWAVGVDDQRLWINLYDYVTFFIHALQIHKGTSEDVSRHEKLVSFYEQKHMNFWRTQGYISQRAVIRSQTPQSLGAVAW